jgi:3',5'-cyclic AMP phosphodiesterase CpdA
MRIFMALLAGLVAVEGVSSSQRPGVEPGERPASLKFAVIGDNGTGDPPQYDVGRQMAATRETFPFDLVLMLGDNLYGRQERQDFVDKFEGPYRPLLLAGVTFYATLGNHDRETNRYYSGFHMGGDRYYTFVKTGVRFIALDSNFMDRGQLSWFEAVLERSDDPWKIVYFHHPLYSDGRRHGSNVELRVMLEPLLVRHGVNVVFSGHEHVYERLKPQKGITYFVSGAGGQLRKGDIKPSDATAAWFDQDRSFMVVEITGDDFLFRTISRTGRVVDSGVIRREPAPSSGGGS